MICILSHRRSSHPKRSSTVRQRWLQSWKSSSDCCNVHECYYIYSLCISSDATTLTYASLRLKSSSTSVRYRWMQILWDYNIKDRMHKWSQESCMWQAPCLYLVRFSFTSLNEWWMPSPLPSSNMISYKAKRGRDLVPRSTVFLLRSEDAEHSSRVFREIHGGWRIADSTQQNINGCAFLTIRIERSSWLRHLTHNCLAIWDWTKLLHNYGADFGGLQWLRAWLITSALVDCVKSISLLLKRKLGLLQPLRMPERRWGSESMDYVNSWTAHH